MSRQTPAYIQAALLGLVATGLTACGGGDSASPPPPAPAPAPVVLATISGTVADGPLSGATVCYDLDDNSRCDTGEPTSAPSDAEGRYSLEIDPALAGKHRVIAMVPASAVDKDTGSAVGAPFTLIAPASGSTGSQTVFVSPLTTLVQAQIDATGSSLEKAVEFVQSQASLTASPLADFTAGTDAGQRQAASVGRLTLLTLNLKTTSLSGVVGQTDLSGSTVSADDLQRVIVREILGALPAVAAVAAEPGIRDAATPAARELALAQAAGIVSSKQIGISAESAKLAVGLAKLPIDKSAEPAGSTASITAFRYQDADNWYYRSLLATAADNTLDANGRGRFYEQRSQRVAGEVTTWAFNDSPLRAGDLHWSGTDWVGCPLGARSEQQPPGVSGFGEYSYCANFEIGVRSRSTIDIGGRSLSSVIETVRATPGGANGVEYADWGPTDLNLLGAATMPAGSQLSYQTNIVQDTAKAVYDPRANAEVSGYSVAAAAGGDARNGGSPTCSVPAQWAASPVTNLDDLIARSLGRPCIFDGNGSTGERNEWWSNSTTDIGSVPGAVTQPAGTGSFYTTTARVRVGFVPGSAVANFYSCLQRASDGSIRNCDLIGTGSYRIEQLGDARALEFSGLPELALRLTYRRVFVERGGKVFYGYRTINGRTFSGVRLNLPAANALFAQLGVPILNPVD